jgi:hypothetical protein
LNFIHAPVADRRDRARRRAGDNSLELLRGDCAQQRFATCLDVLDQLRHAGAEGDFVRLWYRRTMRRSTRSGATTITAWPAFAGQVNRYNPA